MNTSLLAGALDDLERSWSSLDWLLNFWTVLVVVGVAVELVVLITEYFHDWRDFKRGTIHPPDKPNIFILGFGFLGAALVAIGVAGEFQIHVKAGKIESDMRDKTRQLVSIADGNAADADKQAETARREAGVANKEAARLRLEAIRLQARFIPLRISKEQEKRLCKRLAAIPEMVVNLIAPPGPKLLPDPRSGERIWLAFGLSPAKDAGWNPRLLLSNDRTELGVVVRTRRGASSTVRATADRVVKAMVESGIEQAVRGPDFDDTEVPTGSEAGPTNK